MLWRMGRRKVINNLWMKSNKRLGEGRWGRGLFAGLHVGVILRWLQNAAEMMQKKPEIKQMRAHTNMESKGT